MRNLNLNKKLVIVVAGVLLLFVMGVIVAIVATPNEKKEKDKVNSIAYYESVKSDSSLSKIKATVRKTKDNTTLSGDATYQNPEGGSDKVKIEATLAPDGKAAISMNNGGKKTEFSGRYHYGKDRGKETIDIIFELDSRRQSLGFVEV